MGYDKVKEYLNSMGIQFKIVEHEPAYTTEEADKYIEGHDGVRTKTMFLYYHLDEMSLFLLLLFLYPYIS